MITLNYENSEEKKKQLICIEQLLMACAFYQLQASWENPVNHSQQIITLLKHDKTLPVN